MLAVQDALDMRDDKVFKSASGLSGGVGLMGNVCGAILGAGMMLGTYYGRERDELDNFEKLTNSNQMVGKLYKWFEKEFGSTTCRELRIGFSGGIHYELEIPWQFELAEKDGQFEKCADLIGRTAARTSEIMWDAIEAEKRK